MWHKNLYTHTHNKGKDTLLRVQETLLKPAFYKIPLLEIFAIKNKSAFLGKNDVLVFLDTVNNL